MKIQNPMDDQNPFMASLNAVPVCKRRISDTDWFPAVDVSDLGTEYLFEFDLPGLVREEIQISLDGNALFITGVRTTQRYGGKSLRAERPAGAFVRRLVLPADARADEIRATIQNGILELQVPRKTPPNANDQSNIIPFEKAPHEHATCSHN